MHSPRVLVFYKLRCDKTNCCRINFWLGNDQRMKVMFVAVDLSIGSAEVQMLYTPKLFLLALCVLNKTISSYPCYFR